MPMTHLKIARKHTLKSEMVDVPEGPREEYPWGTRLDLDDETMTKMGLDADEFSVDDMIQVTAKGKVISTSKRENQDYETGEPKVYQNVEIQITHLEVKNASAKSLRELLKLVK